MKQTHRPPRSIYPAQNRHMRRRTRVLARAGGGFVLWRAAGPAVYPANTGPQRLRQPCRGPAAAGYHAARRPRRNLFRRWRYPGPPSKTCWTIRASPRELADELVQPAAKALSEILDIDYDATLQKLSKRTSNDCLLRRRVMPDLADAVQGLVYAEQRAGYPDFAGYQARLPAGQLYGLPAGLYRCG